MDTRYLKNVLFYVLTALLSVLLIYYVCYHLFGGFDAGVETMDSTLVRQQDMLALDGYIFRSETLLYAQSAGDINYRFSDGEKVGAETALADVLNGSFSARSSMIEIDRKIALLQSSNLAANLRVTDTASIDRQISELYYLLRDGLAKGDTEYVLRKKDELLVLMNKRRIVVQAVSGYDEQIAALKAEKERLQGTLADVSETLTSPVSGFFYSTVDGYEEIFTPEVLNRLTLDNFDALLTREPRDTSGKTEKGYVAGKLVTDYNWYAVCRIPAKQLRYYTLNRTYTVAFPYNGDVQVPMTLVRLVTGIDEEEAILIFRTGTVPSGFNYLRMQTVELVQKTYTGYRVPVSAVRIRDGEQGVYVLDGSIVRFRKINPLYEADGYLIAAERDENAEDKDAWLGEKDRIIVKGKNLYDGKIIT